MAALRWRESDMSEGERGHTSPPNTLARTDLSGMLIKKLDVPTEHHESRYKGVILPHSRNSDGNNQAQYQGKQVKF